MFDKQAFLRELEGPGYAVFESVLPKEWVARAKGELERAIELEHQKRGGDTSHREYAMVLICSLYGKAMTDLFDLPYAVDGFNAGLSDGSIVYAYTSSSMPPGRGNNSLRIHVDCPRMIPGYRTNMGGVYMLDDFTLENGATWVLPGSQTRLDQPSPEEFYAKAKRVVAPAGSVMFFDARLWHAGGNNTTDQWRHALTINACRPWMKQRLDIPRAMSHIDTSGLSETALQKLGYRTQVPASYEEFYAPPEQRKFRQAPE